MCDNRNTNNDSDGVPVVNKTNCKSRQYHSESCNHEAVISAAAAAVVSTCCSFEHVYQSDGCEETEFSTKKEIKVVTVTVEENGDADESLMNRYTSRERQIIVETSTDEKDLCKNMESLKELNKMNNKRNEENRDIQQYDKNIHKMTDNNNDDNNYNKSHNYKDGDYSEWNRCKNNNYNKTDFYNDTISI